MFLVMAPRTLLLLLFLLLLIALQFYSVMGNQTTTPTTFTTITPYYFGIRNINLTKHSYKEWIFNYINFTHSLQECNNSCAVIPQYWRSNKFLQNFTAIRYLFYHNYAFCHHYNKHSAPKECDHFWDINTVGVYSPMFRSSADGGYSNKYETNPLRCHLVPGIMDMWSYKPHFVYYYRKLGGKPLVKSYNATAAVLNNPNLTVYTFEESTEENDFTCIKAAEKDVASLPFQVWVSNKQNDYNLFNYEYEEYDYSSYDDGKEEGSGEFTTTTPRTTTLGINLLPYNDSKEMLDEWKRLPRHLQGARPLPRWPQVLVEPYGTWCPKELQQYLDSMSTKQRNMSIYIEDVQSRTHLNYTHYVSCVADFPNLPIYGKFEILQNPDRSLEIRNQSYLTIDNWWKVNTLGTATWRSPVVLTDPLPQPFTHNLVKPVATPPKLKDKIGYVCIRSIFGDMLNRTQGQAFIGRVCFPVDSTFLKWCQYRYYYKIGNYSSVTYKIHTQACRLGPAYRTTGVLHPEFGMFNHSGWLLFENKTRRYVFKNANNEWDLSEIVDGPKLGQRVHSPGLHEYKFTVDKYIVNQTVWKNYTQYYNIFNWTWCYNFSRQNCVQNPLHAVYLNASHMHLEVNNTWHRFDNQSWQPVLVVTPEDILEKHFYNVTFLQVDYTYNGSKGESSKWPYYKCQDCTFKFYDNFFGTLIPVFNLSDDKIRVNVHNMSIPMGVDSNYVDTKNVSLAMERSICRWFPHSWQYVIGIHRSIMHNDSTYYDIPLDVNITGNVSKHYEGGNVVLGNEEKQTRDYTLHPTVYSLAFVPPDLDEVTLVNYKTETYLVNADDYWSLKTGCPRAQLWDTIIRYHVDIADRKTLKWWLTQGMDFSTWSSKIYPGKLPYYWYMLLPGSENEWNLYDIVTHDVLHNNTDVFDAHAGNHIIYSTKMDMQKCYMEPTSLNPCLIDRGGFNETKGWVTAHFPRAVLFPRKEKDGNFMKTLEAPGFLPLLHQPVRFLIQPQVQPIVLRLSVSDLLKGETVCPSFESTVLPDLFYSVQRNAAGRRPLQFAAIGAFLAGAALGAAIAGAMTEELRVEISALRGLQNKQNFVISQLSKNLHSASLLMERLSAEQELLKHHVDSLSKVIETMDASWNVRMKQLEATQECEHLQAMITAGLEEIRLLFRTGIGMETASAITILDPTKDSWCETGVCMINLWQMSTSKVVIGYPTKAIPKKIGKDWIIPFDKFYWLKWNNMSYYVPSEATYAIGKTTIIAYDLFSEEPRTSDITISMPQATLLDLGNFNMLSCYPEPYMVRRWQNISYNDSLSLNAGCHIHSNVMMMEHMNLTVKKHLFRSTKFNDTQNLRVLTQVVYLSNHTFGLHTFVPQPPLLEEYKHMMKATEAAKSIYASLGKEIETVHNQTTELLQRFSGETHKVKMLVDSGYLIPRDFQYTYDCSFVGFFRKLVHADVSCIMRWNPFHWLKEGLLYVCCFVLLVLCIKVCLKINKSAGKKTYIKMDKLQHYRDHEAKGTKKIKSKKEKDGKIEELF
ncbi:uncharacterized protein LOC131424505 [Marmota monax]|uniref:uncharacterized protein LOC131424505 n=1 Tax=Marmota monax TaxID=9995 RepID=UPI0026EE0605|nr:uncharacterized protein LOC131424505 [Marmota monax]